MKPTNEEIFKALQVLQSVCESSETCESCPLEKGSDCGVCLDHPEGWELHDVNEWKAF